MMLGASLDGDDLLQRKKEPRLSQVTTFLMILV